MSQDTPINVEVISVEEKPFISPPHSPRALSDSPLGSPETSPALSGTSDSPTSKSRKRSSMAFTSPQARRRGYVRPQGTEFSKSARSRNSVMALGSIAHVQYFFARTGLLEGKGGGMKKKKNQGLDPLGQLQYDNALIDSTYSSLRSSPELRLRDDHGMQTGFAGTDAEFTSSPLQEVPDLDEDDFGMLPPTVSTYKPSLPEVQPVADRLTLKEELAEALEDCRRIWSDADNLEFGNMNDGGKSKRSTKESQNNDEGLEDDSDDGNDQPDMPTSGPRFKDILIHTVLESTTIAVRAAKEYYYATDLERMSGLVSEKKLREEFMSVLDVLKRISTRNEVKPGEKDVVTAWVTRVEKLLESEERLEDEGRRAGQVWLEGDWQGKEWERYQLFMNYFDAYTGSQAVEPLPAHDTTSPIDSPLMKVFQTGHRLILLHNAVVRRSRRPFGQIPSFHTDFNKPYRLAENLRYWVKAAEIRWETKLDMDVMGAVNGTEPGMKSLESAVAKWCERLISEVKREWKEDEAGERKERRRSRRTESSNSSASN